MDDRVRRSLESRKAARQVPDIRKKPTPLSASGASLHSFSSSLTQALRRPDLMEAELDRADAEGSLLRYAQQMWKVLEPNRVMRVGWMLEAMCAHLEAVSKNEINRLLICVPPGTMKPISSNELVVTDRGLVKLGEITTNDRVMTHLGRFRRVLAVHEQGIIPTVTVKSFSGREVRAAPDHPFLTPNGWTKAEDLHPGNYVGAPRRIEPIHGEMSPEEARLLGYLVGDGCISHGQTEFANIEEDVIDDFIRCATAMGFYAKRIFSPTTNKYVGNVSLRSTEKNWTRDLGLSPVRLWLTRHGLWRSNSYTKCVPEGVFQGGEEAMKNFLGAYWTCDGMITSRHIQKHRGVMRTANNLTMQTSATTVSRELAFGLQALCSVLNIQVRVRERTRPLTSKKQPDGLYRYYMVQTMERSEVAKFKDMPGLCERKRVVAEQAFFDRFEPSIYADGVMSVEISEPTECRCLTVDEDHSFVAGGLAVHNSLIVNVFWPSWEWGPKNRPDLRYINASYSHSLSVRDGRYCRQILESAEFLQNWSSRVQLAPDQQAKDLYSNQARGFRLATSVAGKATGLRADRFIIDDPHNVKEAESETVREAALQWFTEVVPTRVNDPKLSARVVIMQRVHDRDVAGFIIANPDLGYEKLILPMEFEEERRCSTVVRWRRSLENPKGVPFTDPRTYEGELLCPERYDADDVANLKVEMRSWGGEYAIAGQLQQRPTPRGGGLFDVGQITVVRSLPVGTAASVRGWDVAGSERKRSPYTAGLKLTRIGNKYYVEDVRRVQFTAEKVEQLMTTVFEADGPRTTQSIPQDPGQAGKAQKSHLLGRFPKYNLRFSLESGSKEIRAYPVSAQVEAGNLVIVDPAGGDSKWVKDLMDEMRVFPRGQFSDQVDALTRAYMHLAKRRSGSISTSGAVAIALSETAA